MYKPSGMLPFLRYSAFSLALTKSSCVTCPRQIGIHTDVRRIYTQTPVQTEHQLILQFSPADTS
eukprot:16319-Eustigmatos_ZCMA.PRE.1